MKVETPVLIHPDDPTTVWSAILTATYQQPTYPLPVGPYRELTLLLNIDAAAADGTGGISIIPALSASKTLPSVDDDVWFIPGVTDGSVTAALPGATVAVGADYTLTPEFGQTAIRPWEILPGDDWDNATDEIRMAITIKCAWAKWFHIAVADPSGAGTLATLIAQVVRHT